MKLFCCYFADKYLLSTLCPYKASCSHKGRQIFSDLDLILMNWYLLNLPAKFGNDMSNLVFLSCFVNTQDKQIRWSVDNLLLHVIAQSTY